VFVTRERTISFDRHENYSIIMSFQTSIPNDYTWLDFDKIIQSDTITRMAKALKRFKTQTLLLLHFHTGVYQYTTWSQNLDPSKSNILKTTRKNTGMYLNVSASGI
jgi:hypothetical protein